MGCDYHQFFTEVDLLNKKLAFIDPVDVVIKDEDVPRRVMSYAHKVNIDYIFNCTIKSAVHCFNYFPLCRAETYINSMADPDGKYTKSMYRKYNANDFSKIDFCSDAEYVRGFETKFNSGPIWFPECCRKEIRLMKKAYDNVISLDALWAEIDRLSKIVIEKCKSLAMTTNFVNLEFYDLEYSSSHISVYPKYGEKVIVIKSTTY